MFKAFVIEPFIAVTSDILNSVVRYFDYYGGIFIQSAYSAQLLCSCIRGNYFIRISVTVSSVNESKISFFILVSKSFAMLLKHLTTPAETSLDRMIKYLTITAIKTR